MSEKSLNILQKHWGFPDFRPLQEDIIDSVLEGNDTLALLPTGGGKSICFQVPGMVLDGLCLVISPLIALMKDQVMHLRDRKISAAAIYTGMHIKDIDRILDNAAHGHYKFLYVSPERLKSELFIARLKRMNVSLLAIDEAHCISQWGYDFRPAYLQINEIKEYIPEANMIALTATATPSVVEDIQDKLGFKQAQVFQKSFERKNLSYSVLPTEAKEEKLTDILKKVPGSAVVYVRNRKRTKEIAIELQRRGISADFYHAGVHLKARETKQARWMKGTVRVMVSTNAFGMGIDKSDVRTVVHMDLPDSLEAYFQEAGRAGRDGQKAYAVLLYNNNDKKRLHRNFMLSFPKLAEVRRVYRALGSYFQLAVGGGEGMSYDFDLIDFCQKYQFNSYEVYNCLKVLEQNELILMTEAVFVPSQLYINVSKEKLYDFQLKNPKLNTIVKSILRTTQGAFHDFVGFDEAKLANFIKIPLKELQKALQFMAANNILEYLPKKEKPQIIFVKERANADQVILDSKMYHFRKDQQEQRIEAAIQYAETARCRSRQLVAYFGQKKADFCGICDVCLGRTTSDVSPKEFKTYKEKILLLLKKEKLTLEEIVESFSPKRREKVLNTIEYLLDEGFVEKEGQLFHVK